MPLDHMGVIQNGIGILSSLSVHLAGSRSKRILVDLFLNGWRRTIWHGALDARTQAETNGSSSLLITNSGVTAQVFLLMLGFVLGPPHQHQGKILHPRVILRRALPFALCPWLALGGLRPTAPVKKLHPGYFTPRLAPVPLPLWLGLGGGGSGPPAPSQKATSGLFRAAPCPWGGLGQQRQVKKLHPGYFAPRLALCPQWAQAPS